MFTEKIFAVAHYADQFVLFVLVLMSVISIAMIFERFMTLKKVASESERVRARIRVALQAGSVNDFEDIAKDPTSIEGRAAGQAMKHFKQHGEAGFSEVFNSFVLTEKPDLEKFLPVLATIASNAPFIGLFGTVLGIMKAFNDLAMAPEAGQQTVMAGISVALVATAAGLFVAIPAGMFFNYFTRKVRTILVSVDSVKELGMAYAKKTK
ncbi:MAG: MotA/TolQ/ExbB proton channel family protein [Pseudobdellovibrio sp.]|nr:MotA/TolQ/ExbB proton channel family protein [Pseudobdellovibrio sp.]